ncbi:transformation/transcription domain-associated protein [Sphaerodactylus townsendi]|uniref:transformation/transcription domain-associated protein n=1 Tax=Sphaerodactylus townsendi TaxID=933632 RepID=UPI002026E5CC|nr:transformation/transcription domain-associated protein [Sphaerodactylus townsendi]
MAFVSTQGPTVVDQTTLMKKYLQFVAALTDVNTPDETKLKMMQEVSENFENVTSSPQYSTFLEHIIPRFLTFLQDGEVQFLQEKPAQQLRKLVLEIIHRIPTNEHLRPHTKNILSVMFRFLETENEENVLICLRIIIELHKQFRPPITQEIHHFLDFVKQIYKELPKVVNRYFENPQVVPENTVPTPEMVGMITTIVVKVNPERDDGETRTHSIIPRGSLSLKVLAELPIIVVLMYQLYKLNIHNVVAEFVPLIMNTIIIQVSTQARQHKLYNKELYADFIAAQIKTLSFLAYIIRIYQELVAKYSQQMVKGMLQLLSNCPAETAHLRKELLIAAKHILTTDLRSQFIPCMDKLFDESILIGLGYTARETLRPLAYSTLADLVHHVRQHLPLNDLSLAVQLFAKNIDDESLPSSIQTMSCKLLLNLVDCIRSKSEQENGNGRDILMRMLEVFVLKFHTIARYQLSIIFKKCKPQSEVGAAEGVLPGVPAGGNAAPVPVPSPAPTTPVASMAGPMFEKQGEKEKEDKQTFQVTDCRSLVKTLVCGVKTITWGITSCKAPGEAQFIPNKQLQPKETQIYIKLVKYAMQALDIYQVQIAGNGQTYIRVANCQTVRMKEEKEVLEHFAGVFTMMNPLTFKEIFQTTVPYMVERISKNYALQIVANSFLANPSTSALFATILVEYLLDRLPEMGSNVELSNLYLKLFKLVFGSVSLFAAENEQMLKPHLHKIVNSSMELAQTAKEPYNYFLLLRALFRSIGGGSHDLLYQEFLPLLPNLLQGLNMLQSGLHKQHMKDLFVELCLTVPVRLSSLLPYLPMLMDPLVSALNGSQTLVSQGLRTLELCVDNLQPDFLYDHIQPVRAELMQALWRTLRNPAETISHVAYRVLGKFGGSNRKMLKESQKLQYIVTEIQGPSITAEFSDCKASIQLPMEKAIETALDCLKSANTEPYYRRQAWEVIKCFLVAMMSLEDNKHALYQLLAHPNFTEKSIPNIIISHRYKAHDTPARRTFEQALTGAFMSAVIKDLRPSALPFVASLIRHYTMVAVAQQCATSVAADVVLASPLANTVILPPGIWGVQWDWRACARYEGKTKKKDTFPPYSQENIPECGRCPLPPFGQFEEMKICSAIINLFHLIPAAPQTLVKPLLEVVMKTERAMLIEAGSPFREPLIKFLTRHPSQTVELFMMEATLNDPQWSRMFMSFLKHKDAKPLRDVLASNPNRFIALLLPGGTQAAVRPGSPSTSTMRLDLQFQAIKIISIIVKHDECWLANQHSLVSQLRRVWVSEAFQERHRKENMAATNWKEPKLLAFCLLNYCKRNYGDIELLFQLLRAFTGRFLCNMTFLKEYMEEEIPKNYTIAQKRALFFRFVDFSDPNFGDELKAKVLQHILNPAFLYSFEKGEGEQLLGPPNPEGDNPESITSVFITKVLDPEKQADMLDSLRIYLLQFATLLVEHAPHHIHDNNKNRNSKLRRLMTFAWPCLLSKACVDPACKYSGHLILAHIIAKFAIHKKIVLQVFHSLLKAHAMEARAIVRQAMAILTPAVPARMEDGHQMLTHWTRKIIVEEGHTVPQLVHILHLIVQHFKVYFPVRHHLVQHMVSAMQRLGFTPSVTIEQRKLAVDLAEVVIKWELQRIKDQQPDSDMDQSTGGEGSSSSSSAVKRGLSVDSGQEVKRFRTATGAITAVFGRSQSLPGADALLSKPIDKQHTDTVVNFLIRIACQVNDNSNTAGSPGELLSRRCVNLLKTALRPDMWPKSELKLQWFDKLLMTVEQPNQANFANICTGLEVLSFLLTVLQSSAILSSLKPLQRGIASCMTCGNTKVLRAVHSLLSRLMSTFPTEPSTSSVASKYEELECLYAAVGKVIYEGLTNYEKATNANPSQLFGTLMILKSACSNNPSYIDRLISVFMRSLQKMVREHLNQQAQAGPAEPNTAGTSELVMLSLDLVKTRLAVMSMEMRKNFIQAILTSLIEKSNDAKILRAVVRIVEEWVKNNSPTAASQTPTLREKSILLVKMMTYIEKRFPEDLELNAQFLDLVNYVYRDESLSGSELTAKLEPAFLSGLRCPQPLIRAKFFEVFDNSMKRRVYERLLYVTCSQNWEAMGNHFWIKQCIELLLAVCERNTAIGTSCQGATLPSITNVINLADSHDRAAFAMVSHVKQEPRERENSESKEEDVEIDIELAPGDQTSTPKTKELSEKDIGNQLHMLTNRHDKFLDSLREVKTGVLLSAFVQLCHISTPLAEKTWIQLFSRLWKILSDRQQHALAGEISPFLCSGSHQVQRDCQPSALNCFVEAMSQCVPPIPIRPCVLKYLGKTHNLWFRSALMLEHQAFEKGLSLQIKSKQTAEFYEQESITPPQQEILDSLAELYSLLQEEDMWAGLWQKRCKFPETATAIAYEQHGFFEQAQETYEKAMDKAKKEHERSHASPAVFPEYQLWEDHWIRCSKELNQWEALTEYGQSKGHINPYLVLECAWRVSNWTAVKEALVQVELSCPKEITWKVNMYRGYLAICHPEEQQLNYIERLVEMASGLAIREWRRLPYVVSHVHTPLLQAAQQIIELQEAAQINAGLQPANLGRNNSLHDMKTVVKTWRNRLPIVSDDLSHWSSIFMWRQHHYQAIVSAYENSSQHDPSSNNAMLGVHASASAIIQYGKIARKQGLVNVALDILSRIHTIPTVPIVDCFQKIRQQVKCYLQLAGVMGKNECMQGLEVIESTNLKYFTKEMTAEFYALKGMFLAQINKSEEANKAFSAAVQMHDVLVKAWAMWGDYLENIFVKERQLHLGVSAITCYLHACRHQNESKSRKYLAKVLWLLSFDDDKNTLAEAIDKYCVGVPPIQWLAWIPQLLTCLVGSEGKLLLNLISQVGRVYPQAVYFPIRTLYLTLKIEQRERYKSDSGQQQPSSVGNQSHSASDPGPIRATAPMWRCSRIMHMQRELHPTLLSSLEGIVDQMVWFRENWHEEVLRQLQQGLAKCYSVAFEKSGAVSDAKITPHTLNFVKKLVSTFGVGLENVSNVSTMFSSAASESLARRAQATAQDPVFQKLKGQFTTDFDFSVPGSMKLHNLISKLKKWIKILEAKTKQLPKFFLIEEKCRFLSNFSAQTAEVEIPGEFLMPKPTHYYIKIARFMPRVEIVQKHNTAARRLYIRGHNGKIYPYLVMNDACLTESRREERVLQLLRLLNPCLEKRKETTKRHLFFTVPRVVAVSPQMRLVEDNPSSLSLVEIYKQRCTKKGIEHDSPISRYYDRLATVQARGTQASHQVLRDILKEVQGNMVPRSMLKEWALHTFPNATDYWTFRKMFTIQLALIGFAEFVFHLNRLNPEMLQIAQDTGKLNVAYFRFDINDATGDLDANRPVPFRLTPNISEFLTTIGVSGPLTASMIAVARCFAQPNFKVDGILKTVLRDEIIAWHKKTQEDTSSPLSAAGQPENMDSQQLVSLVQKAVTAIMTRLHNLAQFEGGESKVNTLVAAANSLDNLCRMDPAWHPWL